MLKLSLLGFTQSSLTDCSDVIPIATGTVLDPFLPAGKTMDDIEAACAATPFPTLSAVPGASSYPSSSRGTVSLTVLLSQVLSPLSLLCEYLL